MNLDIVLRLEDKVDQLLHQQQVLLAECQRLKTENLQFLAERERVRGEIDRILAKLDAVKAEAS
jgi:FtsZ-binding cell division protein ZapB